MSDSPTLAPPRPLAIWRMSDLALGLGLAGLGFLVLIGGLLGASIVTGVAPDEETLATALIAAVVTVLFEAWLGVTVWLLARRRRLSEDDIGLVQKASIRWGAYAVAGAYLTLVVYALLLEAIERLTAADLGALKQGNGIPESLGNTPLVMGVLGVGIVVAAPLGEELFFRAFLFRALAGRFGLVAGLLLSGLLFGAFHTNVGVFIPFFAIGVILAWAYHVSGSLWTPIAAHVTINGISFIATLAGGSS